MCDKTVLEKGRTLESVLFRKKTQEMCDKAVGNYTTEFEFVPDWYKTQKKCVIKPSIIILLLYDFLKAIRLKKCVIKLLILLLMYFILFLIDIRLKKCATEMFLKMLLC